MKLLVGFENGYLVEAGGSWAGANAYEKASACIERIIRPTVARWENRDELFYGPRYDVVGVDSIHGPVVDEPRCAPNEAMVRVAAKLETETAAKDFVDMIIDCVGMEGGGGAGGFRSSVQTNLTIFPSLIPRRRVTPEVEFITDPEQRCQA